MTDSLGTPHSKLKTLSPRAREALLKANITTLEEAVRLSDAELVALPGLKASSLAKLRAWEADPSDLGGKKPDEVARDARRWELFKIYQARGMDAEPALAAASKALEAFYAGEAEA